MYWWVGAGRRRDCKSHIFFVVRYAFCVVRLELHSIGFVLVRSVRLFIS